MYESYDNYETDVITSHLVILEKHLENIKGLNGKMNIGLLEIDFCASLNLFDQLDDSDNDCSDDNCSGGEDFAQLARDDACKEYYGLIHSIAKWQVKLFSKKSVTVAEVCVTSSYNDERWSLNEAQTNSIVYRGIL